MGAAFVDRSWGLIRTYPIGEDSKGKPLRYRALARYRDFDGTTRLVQASGRTATQASQKLQMQVQNRALAGRHGELTGMTMFSDAAELWLSGSAVRRDHGEPGPGGGADRGELEAGAAGAHDGRAGRTAQAAPGGREGSTS